ncbi:MAG: hypothetical protein P1U82_26765 [Verrucomicrobiales bacterium]|nr:hypothetical protein [Verrucomicrobiales bacterium]
MAWLAGAMFGPLIFGIGLRLWAGSSQIIAPGSLLIGDYQQKALAEPALIIQRHVTFDGTVPYLAVTPNGYIPIKGGNSIYNQLIENDILF